MTINIDDRSFVTALCLIIKNDGTSMSYARAGHPIMLKLGQKGEQPQAIGSNGLALGLIPYTAKFKTLIEEVTVKLKKNDRFLIYTDGLTDATNPERNSYDLKRLCELLATCTDADADSIIEIIMDDIKKFTRGAPYHDDLTILAMQVTG